MKKKRSDNFSKFAPKKSNAAVKEQFRQEKRKVKKEREEYFDEKRRQKSVSGSQKVSGNSRTSITSQQPSDHKHQPSHLRAQTSELMPLNKYIAHSGVTARREAADMVKKGLVKVNGELVTEPGHKVSSKDDVRVNGKKIFLAKNLVYILLNKPKDYITTTDDPQKRKTVLDLIRNATKERIYPVGRLDRNTSGVLLLTNDGELAQKLTHPSNEVKKVYHVTLNKSLEKKDFDQVLKGVVLEDGPASVDVLAYADSKDKTQIGVEIHSGRNRIVRRIFESLGYDVKNLDRVIFAGLTKKNVERGKWRFLNEKEVRELKYFGKGK
ncbi:MAG: rRNA pseudouridine synthase [Chitinophagaceae bacterium]|nr:rRNA pseudouridine synthase [Chitinophagaceae bacterium]MBK8953000.1 rRNA pseudouridine synthase [Chitinophagaceae bacterium]